MLINLQETVANFSSYDTKDHILEKAKKKKFEKFYCMRIFKETVAL